MGFFTKCDVLVRILFLQVASSCLSIYSCKFIEYIYEIILVRWPFQTMDAASYNKYEVIEKYILIFLSFF